MKGKKLFFALGAASGGAAIVGSGAFSSMQAERGVSVEVVGDKSALLALEPTDGPNGEYASIDDGGMLEVQVSEENDRVEGSGVNPNSWYDLGKVFKITNQGTQSVGVWIEHDSEYVTFKTNGKALDDGSTPVFVDEGEALPARILVDTREYDGDDGQLIDSMRIHANANAEEDGPAPPAVSVTRTIADEGVSTGQSTTVTLTIDLDDTSDVNVFERFDAELGTASFESASVDGVSISPSFVDLDDGGGIILFSGIGPGEVLVEYTLQVNSNATTGDYAFDPNLIDIGTATKTVESKSKIEVIG